jgi:hypothetical protein
MTVALQALPQFFDNSGNPLSGGKVYTYAAGTLTPLSTYTDRGGLTANPNPVVLDSAGRADIWLSTNIAYKLIVQDSVGNVMDSVDQFYAGADPSQLTTAGIVPSTGGTYTGLVDFTGGATFSGTAAQDLATLDSLGISAVQNANLWINSDFAVNQLGATGAADGSYGFDQSVALCETGTVTLSQLAQPEDGMGYAQRMTQPDAGPKRIGFLQIAEAKDCISYRGKNLSMTVRVRSSAATTVRVALVAWTGTLDAPTRDVVNNWASTTYTAGNFFVANTSTIAVAATALSAATFTDITVTSASPGGVVAPSTMNNLYMVVWTDAQVAQNVTLDASCIRVGQGTGKQIWTPPNAAQELAKCRRYLPVFLSSTAGRPLATGQGTSTTTALVYFIWDTPPRVIPSGVVSQGATYLLTPAGAATGNLTNFVLTTISERMGICTATIGGALLAAGAATSWNTNAANAGAYFTGAQL